MFAHKDADRIHIILNNHALRIAEQGSHSLGDIAILGGSLLLHYVALCAFKYVSRRLRPVDHKEETCGL